MMKTYSRWIYKAACRLLLTVAVACTVSGQSSSDYSGLVAEARSLIKEGKLDEAKTKANQASKADPSRYEAHSVRVIIAIRQNNTATAKAELEKAISLAPADKKGSLQALWTQLSPVESSEKGPDSRIVGSEPPDTRSGELPNEGRRKLDGMMLIIEDADAAKSPEERARLLTEFLEKSQQFLESYPKESQVWIARAAAAIEMERPKVAWEAGRRLDSLGLGKSDDPKIRKLLARLDRKGWLTANEREIETFQANAELLWLKIKLAKLAINNGKDQIKWLSDNIEKPSAAENFRDNCRQAISDWKGYVDLKKSDLEELERGLSSGLTMAALQIKNPSVPRVKIHGPNGALETMYDQNRADFEVLRKEAEAGDPEAQARVKAFGEMEEARRRQAAAAKERRDEQQRLDQEKENARRAAQIDQFIRNWEGQWRVKFEGRFEPKERWKGGISIKRGTENGIHVSGNFEYYFKYGSWERLNGDVNAEGRPKLTSYVSHQGDFMTVEIPGTFTYQDESDSLKNSSKIRLLNWPDDSPDELRIVVLDSGGNQIAFKRLERIKK